MARASQMRKLADDEYLEALRAARAAGHTLAELGLAAGTSKQAIRQYLNRRG